MIKAVNIDLNNIAEFLMTSQAHILTKEFNTGFTHGRFQQTETDELNITYNFEPLEILVTHD